MPRKKSRKSRAMEGVDRGPSQLEVQETRQEQDTTPQYEDVWQVLVHLRAKGRESFPGLWSRKKISSTAT